MTTEQLAHAALQRFVSAISSRDTLRLQGEFALSAEVVDEIYEVLDDYFDQAVVLTAALPDNAASLLPGRRKLIDFYPMNDGRLAVECVLLADDRASEAVLHADFSGAGEACRLHYRYIGS